MRRSRTVGIAHLVGIVVMMAVIAVVGMAHASGKTGIWHAGTPGAEVAFEPYQLGSNDGALVLDGKITQDDGLGLPFKRENGAERTTIPVTGWVKDDGNNLYVALHVSASRRSRATSGDAAVLIKQPGGVIEYRLHSSRNDLGKSGRFETFSGKRKHRIFEFKIPLNDLKVSQGSVELAFRMGAASRG